MKYEDSGVIYDLMDPFKRAAQIAAKETRTNLSCHDCAEIEWTRGESVYVVHAGPSKSILIGFVVEGLGTKNIVADRMRQQSHVLDEFGVMNDKSATKYYANIAIDNAAMVFNDMATLGIKPVVFGQHLAVGSSDWFKNEHRWQGYIEGTVRACNEVRCSWGCGETPTLKGIIEVGAAELSGASWGMCTTSEFIACNIRHGDRIFLLPSSGVHANGLTLCRKIADGLENGYFTPMGDGKTFGEGLLQPTALYGPFIETCQIHGATIHYAVNITGHGWRKLMRAIAPFAYVIEQIPEPQPVFRFIQERGKVSPRDMYADFNMGAGFAIFVPEESVRFVEEAAKVHGITALNAGHIEKQAAKKRVEILPIQVVFDGSALEVR